MISRARWLWRWLQPDRSTSSPIRTRPPLALIARLLLGTGKRLFRDLPAPRELRLEGVTSTSMGSVVLRYAVQR